MESVWGKGEDLTHDILRRESLKDKWLNLGCGDGRYVLDLLKKVNILFVADKNKKYLQKLEGSLSEKEKRKVSSYFFDMTRDFPFEKETFDGVFCTGTLHLFTFDKLSFIFSEITRVLKPSGRIIIDFATDIKRVSNGKEFFLKNELRYDSNTAKKMLLALLTHYEIEIIQSHFKDDVTVSEVYGFQSKGNFFLIIGTKK